jgi:predicted RNA-binding Zn-ribbon protein involved in translation (DUF1610 family)
MAMSNLSDQKALFEAHKKLQEISKTPGLDPETAKNIGGLAAELQERASAATSTSGGGAIGQGGMSQAGMPTGLTIQGKRAYNRPRKSCPKCGSGNFQDVGAKPTPASGKHWDEAKTESVSYKCKDCGHAMTQGQARASKA